MVQPIGLVQRSAASWRRAALIAWTRVNSRNAASAWWQHHKHWPGIIIIIIIIISASKNKLSSHATVVYDDKQKSLGIFQMFFFAVKNEHIAKNTQRMCLDQSLAYKYQSPVSHYRSHYHSKSKLRSLNLAIRSAKVFDQNLGLSTYLDRS